MLRIKAGARNKLYVRDLWEYRELFFFLAWKDILIRYKQTVLGILWAIIQPVFSMLVMTFVFEQMAGFSSDNVPYAIWVFVATVPWQFFSSAFSSASNSLIGNSNLLTKVYFPRLIIPVSAVITALVDTLISIVILFILMLGFGYAPTWRIVMMPVFLLAIFIVALGAGLIIAAINVKYRDFKYIVPFIVQFGMYISPVGYDSAEIKGSTLRLLYSLNPLVGIIDGFRWCIAPHYDIYWPSMVSMVLMSLGLLILGVWYFVHFEHTFADTI